MTAMTRQQFLQRVGAGGLAAMATSGASEASASPDERRAEPSQEGRRPNVLFILVDDLRPEIGCFGSPVKTPHMDRLAREGAAFTRHYCQLALCSPSRTSMLTGLRPDSTGVYVIGPHFRDHAPDVCTLPQRFREAGYFTAAFGKVYHDARLDDPVSWSRPLFVPETPPYGPDKMDAFRAESARIADMQERGIDVDPDSGLPTFLLAGGPTWDDPDVPDDHFWDGQVARHVIDTMRERLSEEPDVPFFLAAGFVKPHLPFVAPRRYFDLYGEDDIVLAARQDPPEGCPEVALFDLNEWQRYTDIRHPGPVGDAKARELKRAYYAATSYVDAQVGRIIAALEELDALDDTVIVLWGDNGYTLGEHGLWGKETNFELATRCPLIVRAPRQGRQDVRIDALTESVDIYPTLCALCGVEAPDELEGDSLVPLLNDPTSEGKRAAFSQYRKRMNMGRSVRTRSHRYTEWTDPQGRVFTQELYAYDGSGYEQRNLAAPDAPGSDGAHDGVLEDMKRVLHAGWRAASMQGRG